MRAPSSIMRMQTVTVFTPTVQQPTPTKDAETVDPYKPVNGGIAKVYNKAVLNNVRYTLRGGISTNSAVNATNDGFYVVIYDLTGYKTTWDIKVGDTLLIPDNYAGSTPPTEGSDTQFYRVTNVSERKTPDGVLHNIGVTAR